MSSLHIQTGKFIYPIAFVLFVLSIAWHLLVDDIPPELLAGDVNNPNFVSHGEVSSVSLLTCPNDKYKTNIEHYYHKDGKLYFRSHEYGTDFDRVIVKTSINPDNKNEFITVISNGDRNIKVPLSIDCEPTTKEITNLPFDSIPSIKRVRIGDFCSNGTLDLPLTEKHRIGESNYLEFSVTKDFSGEYFVINTKKYYTNVMDIKFDKSTIPNNYSIKINCKHNPS